MSEVIPQNGHRMRQLDAAQPALPARVQPQSQQQRLLAAVEDNASLQHVLTKVSTPAGKLLKVLAKALGPAEAEIEFIEKITYREE